MDRLVKVDIQELHLTFKPGHRCSATFKLTNLMHTMAVAVSLTTTTTEPSLFSFNQPFSILPPLSSSTFSLYLSRPSTHPPLSSPPHSLLVRTSMLPTGKAHQEDLRRLFSKPGLHIFKDATIPISFVGYYVVEFLLSATPPPIEDFSSSLLPKAISVCSVSDLTSLLSLAVNAANPGFVSALIRAGGDVNFRDSKGRSLMALAVSSGNLDVVRVLIESGCRIDSINSFMIEAAAMNRVDLMKLLGSGWNSGDSIGRTPVHASAFYGHVDALKLCVSRGGDPDQPDCNGFTPLHCAAEGGHLESVEFLLDCSLYSKHAINKDGKTPFLVAIDNGHSHLLDLLRLSDVLNRAARLGDAHGLMNCINQGAKVNGKDQNGWTPLHRAAFKGQLEIVKLLLSHGAQIDLLDDVGYTPLHCAIEAGHVQVALYLIAHGAPPNLKSLKGVCPLNLDFQKNHPAFVSPLCSENEQASIES